MAASFLATVPAFSSPRPPLPPHPEVWLNAWRFDDPSWLTNARTAPLAFLEVAPMESWSGYALRLAGPNPALLALPESAPDGATNYFTTRGAIRFWFAPDWNSAPEGGGPGAEARLLEFGAWSGQGAVLMVNCRGDIALGFSGSSSMNHVGAFYSWVRLRGQNTASPKLLKAGEDYYEIQVFGDYSMTCLDPIDQLTFWTGQSYARDALEGWGTWISSLISSKQAP